MSAQPFARNIPLYQRNSVKIETMNGNSRGNEEAAKNCQFEIKQKKRSHKHTRFQTNFAMYFCVLHSVRCDKLHANAYMRMCIDSKKNRKILFAH